MKAYKILAFAAATLMLIGCNSQKKIAQSGTATETQKTETVRKKSVQQRAIEAQPDFQSVYAQRANFAVVYQQKKVSGNGTITMLKDSICIISVQPILNIELVRLELTPSDVLLVDKMNKRYVQMTYAEVQKETGLPVTFADIQNLLMARMTVVGQPQSVLYSDKAKAVSKSGQTQVLLTEGKVSYDYLIDETTLALLRSVLTMGNSGSATITYSGHTLHDQILFPATVGISYKGGGTDASCTISLPNLTFNGRPNAQRISLRNYKKTTISTILK